MEIGTVVALIAFSDQCIKSVVSVPDLLTCKFSNSCDIGMAQNS